MGLRMPECHEDAQAGKEGQALSRFRILCSLGQVPKEGSAFQDAKDKEAHLYYSATCQNWIGDPLAIPGLGPGSGNFLSHRGGNLRVLR